MRGAEQFTEARVQRNISCVNTLTQTQVSLRAKKTRVTFVVLRASASEMAQGDNRPSRKHVKTRRDSILTRRSSVRFG